MRQYKVVKKVKELYWVEARTKTEAAEIVARRGDPYEVTVVSQKVTEIKTNLRIGQNI